MRVTHLPLALWAGDDHSAVESASGVVEDRVVPPESPGVLAGCEVTIAILNGVPPVTRDATRIERGTVERLATHRLHRVSTNADDEIPHSPEANNDFALNSAAARFTVCGMSGCSDT